MDFTSSISFPNEPLISWTFLDHFCHHWVCCCFAVAPTQKWWQKWPRNVQLIRRSFRKEILLNYLYFRNQHTLIPGLMHGTCMYCSSQAPLSYSSATWWDDFKTQIIFKGKLFWLPPVHTVLVTWPYTMNWKSVCSFFSTSYTT